MREDEAYYVLSGELEVVVGDEIFVLKAGDTLMAPRDIPHQLRNPGNVENHYLLVKGRRGSSPVAFVDGERNGRSAQRLANHPRSLVHKDDRDRRCRRFGGERWRIAAGCLNHRRGHSKSRPHHRRLLA